MIAGEQDNVYSKEIFHRTAENVKNGRLIIYPGTGHGATFTNKRIADDVTEFLISP